MRRRFKIILILFLAVLILGGVQAYLIFYKPATSDASLKIVDISKGTSFRVIASNLKDAGIIRSSGNFILAARVLGAYKKVKAGEYELSGSMTPVEIIDFLTKGKIRKYLVTIPEGYNIEDIAEVLKAEGLADEKEFISRARDKGFAASLGIEGPGIEGYLFPDSYIFSKGMSADDIITKMVERFKAVYQPELSEAARKKGMTMKQVVTLASIIEKETGVQEERVLVSAVFHNRLKKGIRLQSDPTVVYNIKDFDGTIRRRHLLARTPYNTYVKYGLPPGPIASPGKASLFAAINPVDEGYLYFVSKNDGTHYFSKTLNEHNRAVNLYQRKRRKSGGVSDAIKKAGL